jgi:quercetin dioxygenase-like cupin family protein
MLAQNHFTFESVSFSRTVAHDGSGEILTSRVVTPSFKRGFRFLDMSVVPPGASIGVHRHASDNEEIYIVIDGKGLMRLGECEFEVGPGDVVLNPPDGTHGLSNTGHSDLRLVVIEIPTR